MSVLPFDQRDGFIWMNGALVPWKDAKLHVLSHGLHYGSCVFEGERAYGGKIFKITEHSQRFRKSAEILDFEIPYSVAELDAAKKLVVFPGFALPLDELGHQFPQNLRCRPVRSSGFSHQVGAQRRLKFHRENGFLGHGASRSISMNKVYTFKG